MKSKTCLCVLAVSKLFCLGKVLFYFSFFSFFFFLLFLFKDGERFLPDDTFHESFFIRGSWWKLMLCYTLLSAEGK